jgi:hypothetical protein
MHMNEVIPLAHIKDGQGGKSQADEIEIRPKVVEPTCAFVLKRKAIDLCPPYYLLFGLSSAPQTNHVCAVTCLN